MADVQLSDLNAALGMARADLASLESPLMVFDELDRLRVTEQALEQPVTDDATIIAHRQLLEFIDGLQEHTAMMLVGRCPILETDAYVELDGLTAHQVGMLAADWQVHLTPTDVQRLYEYTTGNPRLVTLCLMLYQREEQAGQRNEMSGLLTHLPKEPALQPLLVRLWSRLSPGEQQMLNQLSVFRSAVPDDGWDEQRLDLERLIAQRLVQQDGRGGIVLLPFLRELVLANLPTEHREILHIQAATVRATRAEYTAAAYHFAQGGDEKAAVQLWFVHRQQEIGRGQADAARAIFLPLSKNRLGQGEQKALGIIRAELHQLRGESAAGLEGLGSADWSTASEMSTWAKELSADFEEALGQPERALQTYGEALVLNTRLQSQAAHFRQKRAVIQITQRELQAAWTEARLAQYETNRLIGYLKLEEGRYEEAHESYQLALAFARQAGSQANVARMNRSISALYGRQQKLEEAYDYADKAMGYYEDTGDRLNLERTRLDLAASYLDAKRYEEVVTLIPSALSFFTAIQNPYYIAIASTNLAEAYLELGELAQAERYARQVLAQEEPNAFPYALYTLGGVFERQNAHHKAAAYFGEAIQIAQRNADPFIEAYAWRSLGHAQGRLGHNDDSIAAFERSLALFEQLQLVDEVGATRQMMPEMAGIW